MGSSQFGLGDYGLVACLYGLKSVQVAKPFSFTYFGELTCTVGVLTLSLCVLYLLWVNSSSKLQIRFVAIAN